MQDKDYLLHALTLAKQRRGFCAPNPSVGAVVVNHDQVIATGNHLAAGEPHAEVAACQALNDELKSATLYVTLEPCCNWGRTPPCTDYIVQKGIKKVIYAYRDPNPAVSGQGEQALRELGVDCKQVSVSEVDKFYRSYTYWWHTRKPFITNKLAISLDAKIAGPMSVPVAITGIEAQQFTHQRRLASDAILTSARTIIQDDPALNVRLGDNIVKKILYVLDSNLRLPLNSTIFDTCAKIILFHSKVDQHRIAALNEKHVICRQINDMDGQLDLSEIIQSIGADGVHDLWVEAGAKVFSTFLRNKLAQKSFIYIAPKLLGPNAYPAFLDEVDLLNDVKKITLQHVGFDMIAELDWC